jgi:eukaryotic-like serine/threonine-protein kinase
MARLDPRYVTLVHDLDKTDDGRLFVVMEYLEGSTLQDVLRAEGPLPPARVLALATQIAQGLGEAHSAGVLHRDVSPQAIMVAPDDTVKLTDFGFARLGDALHRRQPPAEGAAAGGAYAAPERRDAEGASASADLYSLGAVLHEMLTGALPQQAAGRRGTPDAESAGQLRARADIPPALDELVARMLSPDPALRPRDMEEVLSRLREAAAELRRDGIQDGLDPALPAEVGPAAPPAAPPGAGAGPGAKQGLRGGVPVVPATDLASPDHTRTVVRSARAPLRRARSRRRQWIAVAGALIAVGAAIGTAVALRAPSPVPDPPRTARPQAPSAAPVDWSRSDAARAPIAVETGTATTPAMPAASAPDSAPEVIAAGTPPAMPPQDIERPIEPVPREFAGPGPEVTRPPAESRPAASSPSPAPGPPEAAGRESAAAARVPAAPRAPDLVRIGGAVQERLRDGGLLREAGAATGLTVDVGPDGLVTLTGILDTRNDRERATDLARNVPGVTGVRARINVRESWQSGS